MKEENKEHKDDAVSDKNSTANIEKVRSLSGKNKAMALTLAVFLAVSTSLTGCTQKNLNNEEEDEEDESYYSSSGGHFHSGGYFYSSGGSYRDGSWGKSSNIGKSGSSVKSGGYSTARGGSVGG